MDDCEQLKECEVKSVIEAKPDRPGDGQAIGAIEAILSAVKRGFTVTIKPYGDGVAYMAEKGEQKSGIAGDVNDAEQAARILCKLKDVAE